MRFIPERYLHLTFEISLLFKAVFAALEVAGGVAAYFISQSLLLRLVTELTEDALSEDPHDLIANYFLHAAQNYSVSAQHFTALYLVSHGAVKLLVIWGLLKEKLWCYPIALVVFSLFIFYQLYRFTHTHSVWMLVLTAVDLLVIWLTWHEWRYLERTREGALVG